MLFAVEVYHRDLKHVARALRNAFDFPAGLEPGYYETDEFVIRGVRNDANGEPLEAVEFTFHEFDISDAFDRFEFRTAREVDTVRVWKNGTEVFNSATENFLALYD